MELKELKYPTVPLSLNREQRRYLSLVLEAEHKFDDVEVAFKEREDYGERQILKVVGRQRGFFALIEPIRLDINPETFELIGKEHYKYYYGLPEFSPYALTLRAGKDANIKEAVGLVERILIVRGANLSNLQLREKGALELVDDARPIETTKGHIDSEFDVRVQLYEAGADGGIYLPKVGLVYPVRYADRNLEALATATS